LQKQQNIHFYYPLDINEQKIKTSQTTPQQQAHIHAKQNQTPWVTTQHTQNNHSNFDNI